VTSSVSGCSAPRTAGGLRKDTVYLAVLTVHSWLRWVALLLGVAATFSAFRHRADLSERPRGRRWDTFFMLALDLQVLFGLLLYLGLSPVTREAMTDARAVLRDPGVRFWAITHVAMMFVALVAVRMGRVFAMGERPSRARRDGRWICFAIAVVAMVAGVPWPGFANGRPLFRF
jgi:drug/metabolite transporter (DMT)-like permease